ncbi:MAG: UDP-N-acetylmuramate dehydrogenase [Acidobacteriota bacterium]
MTNSDLIIEENISLSPFTTLKVGGPARFFARIRSEEQLVKSFEFAAFHELPVFVLGGGSNLLVSDHGFDGLVVKIELQGTEPHSVHADDAPRLTVAAGEDWDRLVSYCVERDLCGIECLSGIPGSVGGTPVQNVGAYGQEVSSTIVSVRCFDRQCNAIVQLAKSDCRFLYRTSIFNSTARDRYVVLAVTFQMSAEHTASVGYAELERELGGSTAPIREIRDAVIRIRRRKSMVCDPDDPNSVSAGSFFKNPLVERDKIDAVADAGMTDNVPTFNVSVDQVKIPAAWLIEKAGFQKGFRLGRAGISQNHSLALINLGDASAADMLELARAIQAGVKAKFDIDLMPEPTFVGFSDC